MNHVVKLGLIVGALAAGPALAADGAGTVQRNVNQQTRIAHGLETGALNTREAARLERQESVVNHMQSRALKDGEVSAAERARLAAAQNRVSRNIYSEKHDAQVGNPNSASSRRMQAGVERNVNQQARIEHGIRSGTLSAEEAARMQRGQAHVTRKESRAGADGHVGPYEERSIQRTENRQSRRIFRNKHN
jgi:hypothetical protein